MPKKFESRAVIQYKLSTPDKLGKSNSVEIFKIIKDEKTLGAICSALHLQNRWNLPTDQCLEILRTRILANEVRGTDLIDITVRHTDSVDARDIARSAYEAMKSTAATGYEKGLTFELHEEPTIAHYPVSPNVVMIIILGTIVGFFIGIIAAILMLIVSK